MFENASLLANKRIQEKVFSMFAEITSKLDVNESTKSSRRSLDIPSSKEDSREVQIRGLEKELKLALK